MARPISDEELQLKKRARRRLVGAIVLVSAVAVILPMVLDSEPKSVNKNVDIQIPPSDSAEFKPKTATPTPNVIEGSVPVTQPPAETLPPEKAAAAPEAEPSASSKAAASVGKDGAIGSAKPVAGAGSVAADESVPTTIQPARESAKPELAEARQGVSDSGKERSSPAKEQSKSSAKDASAANAYIVQVAALSDASRAKKLQKQIAGAGVKAYTEVVSTKSGAVTRVRAGPYSTREAAEKARARLKKVGLDSKVVPK
jgi:DedD protein